MEVMEGACKESNRPAKTGRLNRTLMSVGSDHLQQH